MRYVEVSDNEILDNQTGLVWQKTFECGHTFEQALSEAARLSLETGLAWRVPTVRELHALVEYTRWDPASDFPNQIHYGFWTDATCAQHCDYAWFVDFFDGSIKQGRRIDKGAIRLVRNT